MLIGIDGIGAVIGVDVENTSYDFEVKGGWGLFAVWALAPALAGFDQPTMVPVRGGI